MTPRLDSSPGDVGPVEIIYDSAAHQSLLLHPERPVELRPSRSGLRRFAFARVGLAVIAISGLAFAPASSLAEDLVEPAPIVTADCQITDELEDGTPSGVLEDGEVCVLPQPDPDNTAPPPPPPPPPPAATPPPALTPPPPPAPPPPAAPAADPAPAPEPVVPPPPPAQAKVLDGTPATAVSAPRHPAPTTAPTKSRPRPAAPGRPAAQTTGSPRGQQPARTRKRSAPREHSTPLRKPVAAAHATTDATTYAALPASWTSLAPLTLPSFSVDGFPIPPFLLPVYQAAAAQYGVPWQILASINEIETNFGSNAGVSSAGAMGWMQFIRSSWARWGTDSDADGRRDPRNPIDAIFAAARYLRDAGAATDLPKAIFAYNHADWYVNRVVERAREFAGLDKMLVAALTKRALREDTRLYRAHGNPFAGHGARQPSAGQALLLTKHQLTRIVLHSDDIDVYPSGRDDIANGRIDRRVLATLVFLARSGLRPSVSSLSTGHSLRTTSGNISAHSYGHAVDISAINGVPIMGHQGADSITAKTLDKLVQLQGYLGPNQIISLMTVDGHDNTLSMGDHDDHIHVGFPRVPHVPDGARPADVVKRVAAFRSKALQKLASAPANVSESRRSR